MDEELPPAPPADFSALPASSVVTEPVGGATDAPAGPLPRWALIADGRVFTIVEQDDEPSLPGFTARPVLAGQGVGPGDTYTDDDGYSPAPVAAAPRRITTLACKMRLTRAERIATRTAALASPEVADFLDMLDSARYVDLDRPDTREGVMALEAGGLLAKGRALEILDAPVMPIELPGDLT